MSSSEERPQPVRMISLCAMVQGVAGGLGWSLLPPLMPLMAPDLGLSHAAGGVAWGAAALGMAIGSPVGGVLVDRHGARRLVGGALVAAALACAARALVVGPWGLALVMLAFGLAVGCGAPALPKVLAAHVPAAQLARANGLVMLAYTLGTAATVLSARSLLVPVFGGWRPVMAVAGLSIALAAGVFAWLVRERVAPARPRLAQMVSLARDPQMLRVACMYALVFGGYLALFGLLPRGLTERGLATSQVGRVVAAWLASAALGNLLGPWLSDRIGRRRPVMAMGAALAAIALVSVALAGERRAMWLLLFASFGGGCLTPLLLTAPLEMKDIGFARGGAAIGFMLLVGQLAGFAVSVLAGLAMELGGLSTALGLAAVVYGSMLLPWIGLLETGHARGRTVAGASKA